MNPDLQNNYREMTILWSFSYNIFVKYFGSYNMTEGAQLPSGRVLDSRLKGRGL